MGKLADDFILIEKLLGQAIHTISHQAHDRKSTKGRAKSRVLGQREGVEIIPNPQWRKRPLVLEVVFIKPAQYFLRGMQ